MVNGKFTSLPHVEQFPRKKMSVVPWYVQPRTVEQCRWNNGFFSANHTQRQPFQYSTVPVIQSIFQLQTSSSSRDWGIKIYSAYIVYFLKIVPTTLYSILDTIVPHSQEVAFPLYTVHSFTYLSTYKNRTEVAVFRNTMG